LNENSTGAGIFMKAVFYFILTVLFSAKALAETNEAVKLFDLASGSDVITYGTVVKLDEQHYYLYGIVNHKPATLKIQRYVGAGGKARYNRYELGQKLFVFLKRVSGGYMLYGAGQEAELPVIKDSVVVPMACFLPKTVQGLAPKGVTEEYKAIQSFMVGDRKVFGLRFTPQYLYQSIDAFNTCYQVILKQPNSYPSFSCFNFFDRYTRERINTYKLKFKLMKLMFMDMEDAQIKNCH